MRAPDYAALDDEQLAEMISVAEDRLDLEAAQEMARRPTLAPFLAQVVMDKTNWVAELPEWWAVVHATYILGLRGGEEAVLPLVAALRWADAYDCDWVTEVLPSIFGRVGPPAIPWLTMVTRDASAGWSCRDVAMKGLAAMSLHHPDTAEHVFRLVGERLMDEGEDRVVRQVAGQILVDFRRQDYRLALLKFAKEEWAFKDLDAWYPAGVDPEEVEWAFRQGQPETWHYREDWMRFYQPAEIQRRQKRWSRERLGVSRAGRERQNPSGGGRVLSFLRQTKPPEGATPGSPSNADPEGQGKE